MTHLHTGLTAMAVLFLFTACSTDKKNEECPSATAADASAAVETPTYERIGIRNPSERKKLNNEWCRACVMSKMGFASCQKVFSDEPGPIEDLTSLKASAREKACNDAGFKNGECPDSAVISIRCKSEDTPQGTLTPGDALQNLYKNLNVKPEESSSGSKPNADSAPKNQKNTDNKN